MDGVATKVRVERILLIFCYFNSAPKLKLLTALIPAGNAVSTVAVQRAEVVVTNAVPAVAAMVRRDGIWDTILFGVDDSGDSTGGSVGGDGSSDSSEGERRWGIILFFDIFNI